MQSSSACEEVLSCVEPQIIEEIKQILTRPVSVKEIKKTTF